MFKVHCVRFSASVKGTVEIGKLFPKKSVGIKDIARISNITKTVREKRGIQANLRRMWVSVRS
jgi:hypothetical protein